MYMQELDVCWQEVHPSSCGHDGKDTGVLAQATKLTSVLSVYTCKVVIRTNHNLPAWYLSTTILPVVRQTVSATQT